MEKGEVKNNRSSNDNEKTSSYPQSSSSQDGGHCCPICLGSFIQESYLDTCFHKFCFKCILQWSTVVAGKHSGAQSSVKCPLCKRENSSVIHGYDGASFVRHYIISGVEDSTFFTKAHKYRLQSYYTEPGVLSERINVQRFWKSNKYLQPNRWLQRWLTREIQALIQEEDVDVIVHHILGVVESSLRRDDHSHHKKPPEAKQQEFKTLVADAARPFIAARTARFVDELEFFLASGLNVQGYDEVYTQQLGWNIPGISRMVREEDNEHVESDEHITPAAVPLLYISDEDCDEAV
ncbi:E3 ubiquitin-protein ligase Topors [Linum grandiflorum]